MPGREAPQRPVGPIALAAAPYAVFLILSLISWNRWLEPYVDSGRELMVPLRVAQGEQLYRDVAFYHGPLGPLLAAGVDRLAGASLPARTLRDLGAAVKRRSRLAAAYGPGAGEGAAIGKPQFFIEIRIPAGPAAR